MTLAKRSEKMRALAQQTTKDDRSAKTSRDLRSADEFLPRVDFNAAAHGSPAIFRKASCSCGGRCPACQAKSSDLKISQPNDPAEIEADQIAERVMRMSVDDPKPKANLSSTPNAIHRKCDACEEEDDDAGEKPIMRKEAYASAAPTPPPNDTPPSIKNVISSGGQPLDPETRDFFEPRLGADLSHVRVHTDSEAVQSARSINAKAYTFGSNIAFSGGEYAPKSESGKHLLAHELAHVIQSEKGSAQISRTTIYRKPAAAVNERVLRGLPKDGISLKTVIRGGPSEIFKDAVVKNGDTVLIKNEFVQDHNFLSIKNGTWAWVEVPRRTSAQKDYPVLHGFIETKYFNEVPKSEAALNKSAAPPRQQHTAPTEYVDFSVLNDAELESEVNLMRSWLNEHSDAKTAGKLATYEAEAARRFEAERKTAEATTPAAAAEPEQDIGDLEDALHTLRNGIYVSPLELGAGGGTAVGPTDLANRYLEIVGEKFLVPATDEMADNPVLRLEASIKQLEVRIAKQKQSIAGWSSEAKLKKAVESAIGQLGGEFGERLKELLTPESLAIMAAFVIAYVVSQTTPVGWVADILIAAMIAATILMVGYEAIEIVKLLIKFVDKAQSAKSQADLDEAGQALAAAITKAGVDVILAILLKKAGKAANLKPPGPRSPGLVEVLETGGKKVLVEITEPATTGWKVAPDGVSPWEVNMSMMEAPPKGAGGPKSSGGSGKGSGTPRAGGEPAKPTPGQDLSAAGGLPKRPIVDAIKGKKPPAEAGSGKPPAVDETAAKSKAADKPTGDTPAKDAAASKGGPVKADPQQGVKSALERINKKIEEATAEMTDKAKEISKLSEEEWALRHKLQDTPQADPGRAKMLKDWKAKQARLTELRERQGNRKLLNDENIKTRTRLKAALEAKTYARPGFTKAERAAVWEQAKTEGKGKVTSPSGVEIKPGDPWEVGHKPKFEFWKHVRSAAERGISREQFLRECKNDLKKYRPETPKDNSSHAFEDATDAYLGE